MISIIDIQSAGWCKVRAWQGELPPAQFHADTYLHWNYPAEETSDSHDLCGAIEIMQVVGPRTKNGLIGAKFTPDKSGNFVLKVLYQVVSSTTEIHEFLSSLSVSRDNVQVGLPKDYAYAAYESFASPRVAEIFGSGNLVVDHAAYGTLGSSASIFRKITPCLIVAMRRNSNLIENDLVSLLL